MKRNQESHAGLQLAAASRLGAALLVLIGFSTTVRADVAPIGTRSPSAPFLPTHLITARAVTWPWYTRRCSTP